VFIAVYVHDQLIRPHGGDFLVVILLYCFLQSFFRFPVAAACIGVLIFAYLVEVSQYYHLVNILGLQQSRIAVILLGTTFSWMDMLCYTAGILLVWVLEKISKRRKYNTKRIALTVS
jgi:hypothetical protein